MSSLLSRLRLAPRLALAFGLVMLVTSLAAGIGIWRLDKLQDIANDLGGASAQRALLARELHAIVVLSSARAEALMQGLRLKAANATLDESDLLAINDLLEVNEP